MNWNKRALEMAAVQADHWPRGHGDYWGKDINGEWVDEPHLAAEFGSPAVVAARVIGISPQRAFQKFKLIWKMRGWRDYQSNLNHNPRQVAERLRILAGEVTE